MSVTFPMHLAPLAAPSLLPYAARATGCTISPPRTACASGGVAELPSSRPIRGNRVPLGAVAITGSPVWLNRSSATYPHPKPHCRLVDPVRGWRPTLPIHSSLPVHHGGPPITRLLPPMWAWREGTSVGLPCGGTTWPPGQGGGGAVASKPPPPPPFPSSRLSFTCEIFPKGIEGHPTKIFLTNIRAEVYAKQAHLLHKLDNGADRPLFMHG